MNTYDDREEKMKAAARKKRRNRSTVKVIFAMLGCLVLLVAVMYGGLTLIDKHMNREQEDIPAMADDVEGDAVDAVSDAVVYSQEEASRPTGWEEAAAAEGTRQIPGSLPFVPGAAGLILAGEVIKDIALGGET